MTANRDRRDVSHTSHSNTRFPRPESPVRPFELPLNKSSLTSTLPQAILVRELTPPLRKDPLRKSRLFNTCTHLFSAPPQPLDSQSLAHSSKNIGGYTPLRPILDRAPFAARHPHRNNTSSSYQSCLPPPSRLSLSSRSGSTISIASCRCAGAQNLAGPPAGYKGSNPILKSPVTHSTFSGAIA